MRPLPLLLCVLSLTACAVQGPGGEGGPHGQKKDGEVDDRVLIDAEAAAPGEVTDALVTTGLLESERQADVVPEATGLVTRVLVEEGDAVKEGQLLAVLANPSLEGAATRASLELDRVRGEAERISVLHGQGVVSNSDKDASDQALAAAQAAYNEATRARGFTRLEAPFAGVVGVRDLKVGEVAGGRRAFQIVDLDALRVVVQLPEKDLPRRAAGQPVTLAGAYDPDAVATGHVLRIAPVVDPTTGTARVTVAVDPGQQALRPGQFVKVRVEVDRREGVLTIPREALVWEDGEPVAWIVRDAAPKEKGEDEGGAQEQEQPKGLLASLFGGGDDAEAADAPDKADTPDFPRREVHKAPLRIGYADPEHVEVEEGLSAGELVVTVGASNLREGAAVRLPADPPPKKEEPANQGGGDAK